MTHIREYAAQPPLGSGEMFPLAVGAGAVDPELIEPREPELAVEELIAFRCCL